jgi:AbrB family looped-hinge helix DNA binding protein
MLIKGGQMNEHVPGTKIAEQLLTRPGGATMAEIIAASGSPQYNLLKRLEGLGYAIRKIKRGGSTRYFAKPPARPSYEATLTSKGQITIPKEVRDHLGVRPGGRLRFTIDAEDHVAVGPVGRSVADLVGILPRPKRRMTIEEMNEAAGRGAVERYARSRR